MLIALLIAAEAWVLWMNVAVGTEINDWTPGGSFRSLEACEARKVESMRSVTPTPGVRITGRTEGMILVESEDGSIKGHMKALCLPATLDPRK
jgi:hypothetical protein